MPNKRDSHSDIKLLLLLLTLIAGVITQHFAGIEKGKQYTDDVMREHKGEEFTKVEKILDQVTKLSTQVTRIETKLDNRR